MTSDPKTLNLNVRLSPSFAKDGDNLTLRFNVLGSEVIQTPTVLIEDQEILPTESGGYWEAVYSVGPDDNGSADFLIAFKDRAGNLGDNVSGPTHVVPKVSCTVLKRNQKIC